MSKHGGCKSIKSILENYIDPEENEKIKRIKAEIATKLRKISEGGDDDKESIRVLIEDFQCHYDSLYARYDYLTKELKEALYGSSSSSSDSDDYYPKKNGEIVEQEANFGSAKSLVKDIGKLIVSKNEEINQLKEDVDYLETELEMKGDAMNALMETMRGRKYKEEKYRKEVEALLGHAMDQTLKGIDTLRVKFEGHFGHLKSQLFEISNELKEAIDLISDDTGEEDQVLKEDTFLKARGSI